MTTTDLPLAVVVAQGISAQDLALDRVLPWVVLLWTLGVAIMAWRAWHQWRALERIAKRYAETSPELEATLGALARRFGLLRRIRVLISDHIDTPTLIGWLKPIIFEVAFALRRLRLT